MTITLHAIRDANPYQGRTIMPPKARNRSNDFQTPENAVRMITPYIPKHWKLWENACGQGRIVRELARQGFDVTGTDIRHGAPCIDFLDSLHFDAPDYDMTITNPPYDVKDQWLRRSFDTGKPFALLMPITALGEQGRVALYREMGIDVMLPPGRIHFTTPSGKVGGGWFYAAWFCKGLDMPIQPVGSIYTL